MREKGNFPPPCVKSPAMVCAVGAQFAGEFWFARNAAYFEGNAIGHDFDIASGRPLAFCNGISILPLKAAVGDFGELDRDTERHTGQSNSPFPNAGHVGGGSGRVQTSQQQAESNKICLSENNGFIYSSIVCAF